MTISITNHRRRLMTLLIPDGDGVSPVRIPHGGTASGLPDAVLELPAVKQGQSSGDLVVQRERGVRAGVTS